MAIGLFSATQTENSSPQQTLTGGYILTPAEVAGYAPDKLNKEEEDSIEALLHCKLTLARSHTPSRDEFILSITVPDNRPALAIEHKARDLVAVILKRHILANLDVQLKELRKFEDGEKSLKWLHSQREVLIKRRLLVKTSFALHDNPDRPVQAQASGGLNYHPSILAGILAAIALIGALRSFSPTGDTEFEAQGSESRRQQRTNEDRLVDITVGSQPLELPSDIAASPLLQALCEEVTKFETQVILILGDSGPQTRTDFTLKLAQHLSLQKRSVRLVDFDLKNHPLSTRLDRDQSLGVSDLLVNGGPCNEFYSSLTGLDVEFSPSGQLETIDEEIPESSVREFFHPRPDGLLLIDACNTSPLHLIIHQVHTVLYVDPRRPEGTADSTQSQVLLAFREARIPVWAITSAKLGFFPMI